MSTEDDAGDGGAKTFTQADVDRIVRDRVARERAKFADYDELKAKAAEADKSKTQLDKIEQQLAGMQERAEKAERDSLLREVADELGLTAKQARRLSGKSRDELLADGREMLDDLGIKPKSKTSSKSKTSTKNDDDEPDGDDAGDDEQDEQDDEADEAPEPPARPARTGRPRESLRSGAPTSGGGREEMNPEKLAALIPR